MEGLEEYSPTLVLMEGSIFEKKNTVFENQLKAEKFLYEGKFPGNEFYEPFGQVTYWERQEIRTEIPSDAQYFILVMDEKNQNGKYILAVGTIEDFSGGDLITILPKAWIDTKLFVNDYISIGIFVFVICAMVIIPTLIIVRKKLEYLDIQLIATKIKFHHTADYRIKSEKNK